MPTRVIVVQGLYVESFVDQDSLHSTRQSALNAKLEALATPEVLAITRPPVTFPVPIPHEHQCIKPSVLQVDKLRRHLVSAQTTLSNVVKERDNLAAQLEDCQVSCCCSGPCSIIPIAPEQVFSCNSAVLIEMSIWDAAGESESRESCVSEASCCPLLENAWHHEETGVRSRPDLKKGRHHQVIEQLYPQARAAEPATPKS
jgi:hypothetical protein